MIVKGTGITEGKIRNKLKEYLAEIGETDAFITLDKKQKIEIDQLITLLNETSIRKCTD